MMVNTQCYFDPYDRDMLGTIGGGVSESSKTILELVGRAQFDRRDPLTYLIHKSAASSDWETAYRQLDEISLECSNDNWDGENASHISANTISITRQLLKLFPPHFPIPEISAEPDGDVNLEWHINKNFLFEVSVNHSGILYYAGKFNDQKMNGKNVFDKSIPLVIEECAKRFL